MKTLNSILKLIKYSKISTKNILLNSDYKCCILIDNSLTKKDIKYFFNIFFNINIKSINLCNLPKKLHLFKTKSKIYKGYNSTYKKCYITFLLKSHLEIFFNFKNLKIYEKN